MSGLSDAVDTRPVQCVTSMHQLKQDWLSSPYSLVVHNRCPCTISGEFTSSTNFPSAEPIFRQIFLRSRLLRVQHTTPSLSIFGDICGFSFQYGEEYHALALRYAHSDLGKEPIPKFYFSNIHPCYAQRRDVRYYLSAYDGFPAPSNLK